MKNLKEHILESLRIGINDTPDEYYGDYDNKPCLLIYCELKNSDKTSPNIQFYGIKVKIQDKKDDIYYASGNYFASGKRNNIQLTDFEVYPSEDYSMFYNINSDTDFQSIYIIINPSLNKNCVNMLSNIDEEKSYTLEEMIYMIGIKDTNNLFNDIYSQLKAENIDYLIFSHRADINFIASTLSE